MIRFILCLLVALTPAVADAGGTCSGVKGGCGRSISRSSSSSGGTVHVRGYTRKDGTYVRPHTRRAPGTASYDPPPIDPPAIGPAESRSSARTSARTKVRTTARTVAWSGNVTDQDETPELPAKYIMFLKGGQKKSVANFKEEDDSFVIYSTNGGQIRYPREMVDRFEDLQPAATAPQPVAVNANLRTWTSADGKFTVQAEFAGSDPSGEVTLKLADGKTVKVPFDKLSETDKEWIRGRINKALEALEPAAKPESGAATGLPTKAKVAEVIDGDTLRLEEGDTLRLIGIDTPETVHPTKPVEAFGKEASEYTRKQLENEVILLTYDQANAATKHRDKYGRLLAYVVRERDKLDFNAEIIRQGFAHAYTTYPLSRNEEFVGYQREAREQGRGLWAPAKPTARAPPAGQATVEESPAVATAEVYVTRTGAKYHRSGCRHLSKSKIPISLEEAKRRYSPCSVCKPPG